MEKRLAKADGIWYTRSYTSMEDSRNLNYPHLSNNAVAALYAETKDPRVKEEVLRRYLPMVHRYARPHIGRVEYEDLISEGVLALLQALEAYNPQTAKFSTYAVHYICGKLRHYLRDHGLIVKMPAWVLDHYRRKMLAEAALEALYGRPPVEKEVADALEITVDRFREIAVKYPFHDSHVSLDAPYRGEEGDEEPSVPKRLTSSLFGDAEYAEDGLFVDVEERLYIRSSSINSLMRTHHIGIFDARKIKETLS